MLGSQLPHEALDPARNLALCKLTSKKRMPQLIFALYRGVKLISKASPLAHTSFSEILWHGHIAFLSRHVRYHTIRPTRSAAKARNRGIIAPILLVRSMPQQHAAEG